MQYLDEMLPFRGPALSAFGQPILTLFRKRFKNIGLDESSSETGSFFRFVVDKSVPRKTVFMKRLVLAAAIALFAFEADAQRVQFPTTMNSNTAVYPPVVNGPPQTFAQGPVTTGPVYGAPPQATLDGTIQPLNPNWDPYSDPSLAPPQLLPQQNYLNGTPAPYGGPQRLIDQVFAEYTWINRNGGADLGFNIIELNATGTLPIGFDQAPLLITPGFAVNFLSGPDSTEVAGMPALPGEVYDAYLDAAWNPRFGNRFGADIAVRIGVYSDFQFFDSSSLRYMGRGMGVYTASPQWQFTAGIIYYDRLTIKLLPAGGAIWTPNPDARYEILFPNPKLAQRLTTIGNNDLWGYVSGNYGGGAWTYEQVDGTEDEFEYNDIRVMLGLEMLTLQGSRAWFEVGYLFNREVNFRIGPGNFDPSSTIMIRSGLSY